MHVFDGEIAGHPLQMPGNRGAGGSEIKAIVGNSEVEIDMSVQEKTVPVGKRIRDCVLVAETSTAMQIASEDVARLHLEQIARNRFGLVVAHRLNFVLDRSRPSLRAENEGGENG